jgi:hypothetical protein
MLKKIAIIVFYSFLLANFALPGVNAAEDFPIDQFPYKEMQIQVMPEFDYPDKWPEDQPSLLVGYYGTFINKTGKDFNGEIEFPAPVNDKNFEIYLVAEFPSENEPEVQRPFEVDKEKGVIKWKPGEAIKKDETYSFVVEYYTNPFEVGDSKKFSYDYTSPTDTEKLDIIVYEPLKSTDFKIQPAPANTTESDYGEKLYIYQYTNAKKNDAVHLSVSYVKKDNKSTLSVLSEQAPKDENHNGLNGNTATEQVLNNNTKSGSKQTDQPIIGIGGAIVIGISIIIAGAFVFLGLKANSRSSKTSRPNSMKTAKKSGQQKSFSKKDNHDVSARKKKLRTLLVNGEIDEETYQKELEKLG